MHRIGIFVISLPLLAIAVPAAGQDAALSGMWDYRLSEWTSGDQVPEPVLTAAGEELLVKKREAAANGYTRGVGNMKCLPIGFPGIMFYRTPIQIMQDFGRVSIVAESSIEPRTIYLGHGHPEYPAPSWNGHSVGEWTDGDLIVDTISLNGRGRGIWKVSRALPGTSEQAHVVERFHVEEGGEVLTLTMTVTDPVYYAEPYTVTVHYDRLPDEAERFEAVCEVDLNALAIVDLEAIKDVDAEAERMLDPELQYNPIESSN